MRSISPMWGFVALILAAVLVSSLISSKHTNDGAIPPVEQAKIDEQKQIEEANKYNATHKAPPVDNKTSATNKTTPNKTTSVDEPTPAATPDATTMTFDQAKEGAVKATMQVQAEAKIVMELYPKAAPKTVAHFLDLCRKHFYDGTKFHRLEPGFVVQGGDPESKDAELSDFEAKGIGTHGSGTMVPLEAHLLHKKYSIGQARSQALDSGDSQFYFNLNDNTALDGKYCVFGMVVEGQDVVDKIEKGDVITSLTPQ